MVFKINVYLVVKCQTKIIVNHKFIVVSIGRYVSVPTSQCNWQIRICTDLLVQLADTFYTYIYQHYILCICTHTLSAIGRYIYNKTMNSVQIRICQSILPMNDSTVFINSFFESIP